ncbi:MAG: GIY-YIG nuclease family protein [Actinomycetota bacterium]
MAEITQKWGFGMAPVKPATQQARVVAVGAVLDLCSEGAAVSNDELAEHISTTKGLFSRVRKQDQWDWCTVWEQLGYPGDRAAARAVTSLADARRSVLAADGMAPAHLRQGRTLELLSAYVSQQRPAGPAGHGFVYVMSTREARDVLKVGYTTQPLAERCRQINAATGVLIPYGVRAAWKVKDPARLEKEVHVALADSRIRSDREFFRADYRDVRRAISEIVRNARALAD